mgnify:CR=1 FL=1
MLVHIAAKGQKSQMFFKPQIGNSSGLKSFFAEEWNFPGACGGRNSDSVPACRCGALCPYG